MQNNSNVHKIKRPETTLLCSYLTHFLNIPLPAREGRLSLYITLQCDLYLPGCLNIFIIQNFLELLFSLWPPPSHPRRHAEPCSGSSLEPSLHIYSNSRLFHNNKTPLSESQKSIWFPCSMWRFLLVDIFEETKWLNSLMDVCCLLSLLLNCRLYMLVSMSFHFNNSLNQKMIFRKMFNEDSSTMAVGFPVKRIRWASHSHTHLSPRPSILQRCLLLFYSFRSSSFVHCK